MTRTFESKFPWETIVVSKDKQGEVKMLQLFRNDSIIESSLIDFSKTGSKLYSSSDGELQLEIENPAPIVRRDGQSIELQRIKNSPAKSNRILVEQILDENFIVHANIHQTTYFDCRSDSNCYFTKKGEQVPYDTSKWHLVELNGELFLSYRETQRGFTHVFVDHGELYFASSSVDDGPLVYKVELKTKKNNNL